MDYVKTLVVHRITCTILDELMDEIYDIGYFYGTAITLGLFPTISAKIPGAFAYKMFRHIDGKLTDVEEELLKAFVEKKSSTCPPSIILNDLVRKRKLPSGTILIEPE